jgi:hypothetical protein
LLSKTIVSSQMLSGLNAGSSAPRARCLIHRDQIQVMGWIVVAGLRMNERVDSSLILKEKCSNAGTYDSLVNVHQFRGYPSKPGVMEAPRSVPVLLAEGCRINGEIDCREI